MTVPYCFDSGKELPKLCSSTLSISQLMRANELAIRSKDALIDGCQSLYDTMRFIDSGMTRPEFCRAIWVLNVVLQRCTKASPRASAKI